ncbi:hypothetical protein FFLO_03102 [Filobasidium floriforme]|uniref:Uncharacterized protein n=1 Tax=Filobasidium floriforme TaxID=5210 RepID=A0A8K0JNB9_9TREE|nr:uncharacterized protein HD553DRAFT_347762 [Filobasidium floriforme]KAG7548989.1 hypothetical protein FFLO_03102 [Filobasidium floriforme]KAH8089791.1 hypothetical protein HD553DRAFT_347762 [Filobasidium floriforme]
MSGRAPQQPLAIGAGASSPLTWFWNDQVVNPEHRAGNINIAIGVTTFALGVLAVRNFGGILVPGF